MIMKSLRKKILLIDDTLLNRDLVSDILDGSICDLSYCSDPHEGLRTLMLSQPDLLLLDVDMPEINGIELLKQIRSMSRTYKLPVFMFTAHSSREVVQQTMDLGVTDYLVKPFEATDLINKLNKHFGEDLFDI